MEMRGRYRHKYGEISSRQKKSLAMVSKSKVKGEKDETLIDLGARTEIHLREPWLRAKHDLKRKMTLRFRLHRDYESIFKCENNTQHYISSKNK